MKSLKKTTLGDAAASLPIPNVFRAGEFLSVCLHGTGTMPGSACPATVSQTRQHGFLHPRNLEKKLNGIAAHLAKVRAEIRGLWRGGHEGSAKKLRLTETKLHSANPEFSNERQALLAWVALPEQKLAAESLIARTTDWTPLVKAASAPTVGHASDCRVGTEMPTGCQGNDSCALAGRSVLCVGGRATLYPEYRRMVEAAGGNLMIYRGGVQDSMERLSSLLADTDLVICPVDCVGHNAYFTVKRYCKHSGKPCALLDRSSLATFRKGVNTLAASGRPAALSSPDHMLQTSP